MKILTLNTWQERGAWKERWEVVLQGLARLRPEIACFQELFNPEWAKEVQMRSGYPTLLFPQEASGLVVYTKYPVVSWGIVQLQRSPLEEYSRYLLWAELWASMSRFFVFNTHLSWKPEDGATRQKQVEEVSQGMEEKARGEESLLVGDLNAVPQSPEIRWLIHEGHLHDVFTEKHQDAAGFTWDNRNPYVAGAEHPLPDRRIDYLLARHRGPVLKNLISASVVFTQPNPGGIWASDHFGVLAEFK